MLIAVGNLLSAAISIELFHPFIILHPKFFQIVVQLHFVIWLILLIENLSICEF